MNTDRSSGSSISLRRRRAFAPGGGLCVLLFCLACGSSFADEEALPKHLAVALDFVARVPLDHTSYKHGEPALQWDGLCESYADCSGFIDALLQHAYGYTPENFKAWFDSRRPSARRYHDAIVAQAGFEEIYNARDVRAGDLLAVKYLQKSDNTGHVMLVAEAPHRLTARAPVVPNTDQWAVNIVDSSESGHGPDDTRHGQGPGGKDHDGLGRGTLRIYSDPEGHIAGFTWSTLASSAFKEPGEEHLVAGRLKIGFKPE